MIRLVAFAILVLLCLLETAFAVGVIVPGAPWVDTSGNPIQAHGAGIFKVGSTYYWVGEDKSSNSILFHAVSCYTSSDLLNWSRQNNALTPISGTMISSSNVVERPKVMFNQKNSQYVMWFHSDTSSYSSAMVGVATSSTPCGPYTYQGSFKPLGADSRDMSVFQDNDANQTAYLLYASDNNQNFKIAQMDSNYYNVTVVVSEFSGATLEAPGMIKRNNVYYLFASHTSGWDPNPNKWFSSSSISGSWTSQADLASEATRTYYSQNAFDLGISSNFVLYMGDRWDSTQLGSSSYIWIPMDFSSGSPKLVWADVWSLNIGGGSYSVDSGTTYLAANGQRGGSATEINNTAFTNGHGVGFLGKGGTVTLSNVQGTGASGGQWVAVYYANGDSTWRNTTIIVNGGQSILMQQPDTGSGNTILSMPVKLNLNNGANTIEFGANQNTYAGDLDRIIVFTQS